MWKRFYQSTVRRVVFDLDNRHKLDQWVKVARLPFDADDYSRRWSSQSATSSATPW